MMSVLGLVISLALFLTAFAIVARPLWTASMQYGDASASLKRQSEQLRNYYERVLTNMRDLDEDYATGKMNAEDYHEEREVWVERGIRLLRAQDSLELGRDSDDIDKAIEEAILAYRQRGKS